MGETAACRVPFDEQCLGGVPFVCSENESSGCEVTGVGLDAGWRPASGRPWASGPRLLA
jgi:hypothetical protein